MRDLDGMYMVERTVGVVVIADDLLGVFKARSRSINWDGLTDLV
jgi:hypothetical protein